MISTATAGFGELDGLVISAGIFQPGPIDEMSPEFWDRNMAINVRATFLAVQAAAPSLRRVWQIYRNFHYIKGLAQS